MQGKKGCKECQEIEADAFPIRPDRRTEAAAIKEYGLPEHNNGNDAGYLAQQNTRNAEEGSGYERDRNVDNTFSPSRPYILIIAVACIEKVNSSTGQHNKSIDHQEYEDGGIKQVFPS